jgi:iron complex transport system substrate-binding protein
MKKLWIAVLAIIVVAASCTIGFLMLGRPAQEVGVKVVDQLGREVYVKKAERIVSLWPEATRVLFALGVGDRVVGVDSSSRTCPILTRAFPQVANITDVGSVGGMFDIEKIAKLRPDVIFMRTDDRELAESVQAKLGVPVVCVRFNPPGERDWSYDIISIIGTVVGKKERADQLRTYLEGKLSEITKITSAIPDSEKPRVYQAFARDLLKTQAWVSEIMYGGGINVAYDPQRATSMGPWISVSLEQVIAWNPDIIILHGFGGWKPEDLYNDPNWQPIKAVKERKVYKLTMGWTGWDPAGTVIQTMQCAKIFHPDKFKDLDVESEANKVFKFVYGVDGLYTRLKKDYGLSI